VYHQLGDLRVASFTGVNMKILRQKKHRLYVVPPKERAELAQSYMPAGDPSPDYIQVG